MPLPLKPAADLSAISAETRFSPALCIHFSTCSAMQASIQGCSTTALGAGSNGEQAEWNAVSLKEVEVAALEEVSRLSSVTPVTTLCSVIFEGWEEAGAAAQSVVGSHLLGSLLPRELQQMNWLLIRASILTNSSLVKHAENVTSSATRPIEPCLRSLSNFLSYFNKRRQAHRQNGLSHTSGNSSSRNTY